MSLPEWAAAPGPGFKHNNNYSPLEVVWIHATTGEIVVQDGAGSYYGTFGEPVDGHPIPRVSRRLLVQVSIMACIVGVAGGAIVAHILR